MLSGVERKFEEVDVVVRGNGGFEVLNVEGSVGYGNGE